MKIKGWFKSWRVPIGEDSEYEGDYMVGDMPSVWVYGAIYWTHKSWGLTKGRQTPLDGFRAMWLTRGLWEARTAPPEACAQGLTPKPQWRGETVTAFVDTCFPNNCPLLHTPCFLCVRSALEQGLPWPGRKLRSGKQRCIWPRVACGWNSQDHAHGEHLHRHRIRRSPDLWGSPDCHSRWPSMCPEPMRASTAQ